MICREAKADYFSRAIWTTQITLNRLVKFVLAREAFCGVWNDREWYRGPKCSLLCRRAVDGRREQGRCLRRQNRTAFARSVRSGPDRRH
jgi:hypothetical protein